MGDLSSLPPQDYTITYRVRTTTALGVFGPRIDELFMFTMTNPFPITAVPESINVIVPVSSFDGAILDEAPTVESGNEIETIVEEVTSDGIVTLSFMIPV